MGNCHVVGPDEVMVVSGGCCNAKRTIIGGCAFAICGITDVQRLSLNTMTLVPTCRKVETLQGVQLTVTAVAQIKVMCKDHMEQNSDATEDTFLMNAMKHLLGRSQQEIHDSILETLEGHLRAILGSLSVESIYADREQFAGLVRETAAPDLANIGLQLLSFTIRDVTDDEDYLNSLGRKQTARVTADADIGVANADRDKSQMQSKCNQAQKQVRLEADSNIADAKRAFETAQAGYRQEVQRLQAESNLAFALREAHLRQAIVSEQMEIEVVVRTKQIEVEDQEVLRKEKELVATVNRPAEAEQYKIETLAEGRRTATVMKGEGEAEKIRLVGGAEARAIRAVGEAEAVAMSAKAGAFSTFGEAAVMSLILESLPKIAAEVAAPMGLIKEIVVLPQSTSVATEVSKLVDSLPDAVQQSSGVDISGILRGLAKSSSA